MELEGIKVGHLASYIEGSAHIIYRWKGLAGPRTSAHHFRRSVKKRLLPFLRLVHDSIVNRSCFKCIVLYEKKDYHRSDTYCG